MRGATQEWAEQGAAQAWKCLNQLRTLFRALPAEIAFTGLLRTVSASFDADTLPVIVAISGQVGADAEDLRSTLSDTIRQALRRYLVNRRWKGAQT